MLMYGVRVTKRRLGFSAVHFLVSHEKCSRVHGHNYRVTVGVRGEVDEHGILIDFNRLTEEAAEACRRINHKVIVPMKDPRVETTYTKGEAVIRARGLEYIIPESEVIELPVAAATAEELARYLYTCINERIRDLSFVEIEETPGSVARYAP